MVSSQYSTYNKIKWIVAIISLLLIVGCQSLSYSDNRQEILPYLFEIKELWELEISELRYLLDSQILIRRELTKIYYSNSISFECYAQGIIIIDCNMAMIIACLNVKGKYPERIYVDELFPLYYKEGE